MRAPFSRTGSLERTYEFFILNCQFLIAATAMLLAAAAISAAQPPASQTAAELKAKFERRLAEIAARVDGVVGYEIIDSTSGDRFAHLERETFPTASTIKLTLVYELFKQAEEGKIRLDDTLVLDRAKAVGGIGVLVEMGAPTLSIRDYAVLMVTLSDNTATNVRIDRLGMENVARRMQALALTGTKLRRHMMDTAAARRGDENVSTPDEIARLLEAMSGGGRAGEGRGMADAIALLKKPKDSRLRKGLPDDVATADKPGEPDGL